MKRHCTTHSVVFRLGVVLICALRTSVYANVITVTNINDSGTGSLRQALTDANDADTIVFAVTGTIGLTSGGLLIAKNIIISGPGSNQLTIDGNQAVFVFRIFPGKTATISGLTIRNAEAGAGVWNEQGTLTVSDCAVTSSDDGGGYLNGPGDQIKTDPLLGPLQDNGGPTLTQALLPGSPAIDAGDPNFTSPLFYDQRGCPFLRVFNGRVDIGSFEAQPPQRPCTTPRPRPTPPPRP